MESKVVAFIRSYKVAGKTNHFCNNNDLKWQCGKFVIENLVFFVFSIRVDEKINHSPRAELNNFFFSLLINPFVQLQCLAQQKKMNQITCLYVTLNEFE